MFKNPFRYGDTWKERLKMATTESCSNKQLCCFAGPGCDKESEKSCLQAMKVRSAYLLACPAFSRDLKPGIISRCDIPKYRALVTDGCACGKVGECFVRKALQGKIPAQDFNVSDHLPKSYEGQRSSPIALKESMRNYSL